jgi:hypothetical protein
MPAILATWEVEIGMIMVSGQPRKVCKTLSPPQKAGQGGTHLSFYIHTKYKYENMAQAGWIKILKK